MRFLDVLCIVCIMTIPVVLFIIGVVFTIHPQKTINNDSGHRTKRSKVNQNTWDFAQKYMGKVYVAVGAVYTIASAVVCAILVKQRIKVDNMWLAAGIIVFLQCTAVLIEYCTVEYALKSKFDDIGNRKVD